MKFKEALEQKEEMNESALLTVGLQSAARNIAEMIKTGNYDVVALSLYAIPLTMLAGLFGLTVKDFAQDVFSDFKKFVKGKMFKLSTSKQNELKKKVKSAISDLPKGKRSYIKSLQNDLEVMIKEKGDSIHTANILDLLNRYLERQKRLKDEI